MKLSINAYAGYANMPEFTIDYGEMVFDQPLIIQTGDNNDRAWYLSFNYDLSVLNYRRLCKKREDANTNFGYKEHGYHYESGWSSRASVVNQQFGFKYVDISQRGIELDKLLYMIHNRYVGEVYLAVRSNTVDHEYVVVPFLKSKIDSYDLERKHLIIDTIEEDFVERALSFLTGVPNMYDTFK